MYIERDRIISVPVPVPVPVPVGPKYETFRYVNAPRRLEPPSPPPPRRFIEDDRERVVIQDRRHIHEREREYY